MAGGIQIADDQLNRVMAQAVLTYLTPEKRDELLLKAVTAFFATKDATGYDKRPEIERAFSEVMAKVSREVTESVIRNDPAIMARIKTAAHEGLEKALSSPKFVEQIASGVGRALNLHL